MKTFLRIIGFLTLCAMFVVIVRIPAEAEIDGTQSEVRLVLHSSETGDGILELLIELDSSCGISAMLCELEYDPDVVIYLSGGASDSEMSFKAIDFGGSLRFLIDSNESSAPCGELARLYFKVTGNGKPRFSLTCRESALYIDGRGEICPTAVKVTLPQPEKDTENDSTDGAGGEDPSDETHAPRLLDLEIRDFEIAFTVGIERGFAAGVRLFIVDLDSGESADITVAGVVGEDGVFTGKYRLQEEKSYSVIVTPLSFCAEKRLDGEKKSAVIAWQNQFTLCLFPQRNLLPLCDINIKMLKI